MLDNTIIIEYDNGFEYFKNFNDHEQVNLFRLQN